MYIYFFFATGPVFTYCVDSFYYEYKRLFNLLFSVTITAQCNFIRRRSTNDWPILRRQTLMIFQLYTLLS